VPFDEDVPGEAAVYVLAERREMMGIRCTTQSDVQEADMVQQRDDEEGGSHATPADGTRVKQINDPLTRTDVDAPRIPFGTDPPSED
jgi:hypothetical protein